MGHTTDTRQSLFRKIAKDKTANTIAIAAASLVPLMAMVGGGVDASRYYMTETRLQAACDAGALAARRAMDDDAFTSAHRTIGNQFFNNNFPSNTFGSTNRTRAYAATADGEVKGTASVKLPTTIMGAFGYNEFNISVECTADINISNTDIMLVLDVTGSMAWEPDGSDCGTSGGNWVECSGSRISGLREAVMTFYDTVEDATSASAQVRYGVVPYSSNVNVGAELAAANPAWLAQSHTYQSREGDEIITYTYETQSYAYTRTGSGYNYQYQGRPETNNYGVTYDQCVALINSRSDIYVSSNQSGWTQVSQSGSDPRTTTYNGVVKYERFQFDGGYYYGGSERCQLFYRHETYDAPSTITETEGRVENREFTWVYKPVTWDLTTLYDDNQISLPTGLNFANETVTWDGCVEEANTVAAATFNPVPAGANDLDINLVPNDPTEYWKPVLRNAVWKREDGSNNTLNHLTQTTNENRPGYYCPRPAFRLEEISRADLQTYVNALIAAGSTYHDFGMIWGARFISPRGIFAADNATAPNGDAISRHIVFMTDGELSTNNEVYGMYGVEWWDRRVTSDGSTGQADIRHAERFQAACRAARNENVSVWVVAFGTNLTQNLIDCATPGRAFQANDTATLTAQFRQIAQQIAALRLTQ
ncbi:pilus assembly protein TadG-related protein [Qipengyuania sp. ASV99]|uniref:pilus assembly protein TadG-related protein n=1 Tax=Qipengyuania sp. ASV99 TaxID=3399681 RepID=UPI003A4C78C5